MAIVVFQHWDTGRPGRLGATLREHAFKLRLLRPDRGDQIPQDYDDVDAVISLGGPQNVGDPQPWIAQEIDFIRGAHARALPIVGVCLGHQFLAAALGGEVGPMATPELGFVDVDLTPAGQTDTMLAGVAWRAPQYQSHGQEVKKLPPGAALLASSAACKVQAFRAGLRSYGFQYHFEVDPELIQKYAAADRDQLARLGLSPDHITRQAQQSGERFARLGDRLCLNIATYLIPRVGSAIV